MISYREIVHNLAANQKDIVTYPLSDRTGK